MTIAALALAGLWWLLNADDGASWLIGIHAILLGSAVTLAMPPIAAARVSLPGAVRFAGYFIYQSVLGSLDVAARALQPRRPMAPGLVDLTVALPAGLPRIVFANTVTLLPGTLTARIDGERLVIHAIDTQADLRSQLLGLEERVRDLFGLPAFDPGARR